MKTHWNYDEFQEVKEEYVKSYGLERDEMPRMIQNMPN